jgi:hypothetical protein
VVTIAERDNMMNAPQKLPDLGQSLWLDNITRDLLKSGTLHRYINEFSVTGLTFSPSQRMKPSSSLPHSAVPARR